uniref:Potassium channel n=1 Tax=Nicotiana tabacum TaxID=4097 RepID=A0A1S3Y724_TOBAC|nr:PREDICTED: potassium channel SKOR-like [Nicotiana tabacum]
MTAYLLIWGTVEFWQVTSSPRRIFPPRRSENGTRECSRPALFCLSWRSGGGWYIVALLEPNSSFGDISIVCNLPQPYTVRVCQLCRLIRIDKQSFSNILEIYFHDGRRILSNLLQVREMRLNLTTANLEVVFSLI